MWEGEGAAGRVAEMVEEGGQMAKVRHEMAEESLEVLEMVKEGRVTPEEGVELLEALKGKPSSAAAAVAGAEKPRFLRVRVQVREEGGEGDKVAVNVNLPVAMADVALKVLREARITREGETIQFGDYLKDLQGMDISTILQMVKEGAEGKLVDVDIDEPGGDKVKVEVIVD